MKLTRVMIISLVLATIVGLGGCLTVNPPAPAAPAPAAPVPPPVTASPEPPQEELWSWDELTVEDIRDQMTILEWPSEAYVGDYITVRVETMSGEFWEWLQAELIKADGWGCLTYELALTKDWPDVGTYDYSFGVNTSDEDRIVSWYGAIPTTGAWVEYNPDTNRQEFEEGPFPPGSYKLELRLLDPCSDGHGFCGYDVMLERNIIIKE